MEKYDTQKIEEFSQEFWKKNNTFQTGSDKSKKKFYVLDMFPYPSGDGLHVGHVKGYTATDIISHYKRLKGFNVLHPMGWDAFGLPAENYAIKVKKNPKDVVSTNISRFKAQLDSLGFSYDWSKEINTTDPGYYKWTQWIFLQLFKKGLAYEDTVPINFCPSCKTGLANEEVVGGKCERCGTTVERKKIRQWILKITEYADRLLAGLDTLDWPESIKEMQRNWIGRSEGSDVVFDIKDFGGKIKVYTTRADTLFGCTYVVLAPEHRLIDQLKTKCSNAAEVDEYIEKAKNKSDLERTELAKEKSGVELKGIKAINPINGREVSVWVADYVLGHYGTGAVMAVPAHDERDFEFAKKYGIEVIRVIKSSGTDKSDAEVFIDYGILFNSDIFNGLDSANAKKKITERLKESGHGEFSVNYKLRDWVFSRQRYWGEPIPIIHCEKCGAVPVPESDLPVKLPDIEYYEPSGDGSSPLSQVKDWVNVTCPVCGEKAKRETNTMPQWAGSCWYYLRFEDPSNELSLISKEADEYFSPVDFYIGGAEHAVLHLLYARFWHKFLHDLDIVKYDEPFKKLKNVGLIIAPDRQKMSKSRGNVINPDDIIKSHGADALRMYEMFIGPFDQSAIWSLNGVSGTHRFLEKIHQSFEISGSKNEDAEPKLAALAKNIESKIEHIAFNTAISDFMKFSNEIDLRTLSKEQWESFLITLSPFAPHLCEYLFHKINDSGSIFGQSWPVGENIKALTTNYIIQIDGKKKMSLELPADLEKNDILCKIYEVKKFQETIERDMVKKVIFVKNRLVNFVTS